MTAKAGWFSTGRPIKTPILNAFKIGVLGFVEPLNKRLKLIGAWYLYLSSKTVLP